MRKLDDGPARSFCFYLETYSPGKRLITSEILCLESSEMTLQKCQGIIYNSRSYDYLLCIYYGKRAISFYFPTLEDVHPVMSDTGVIATGRNLPSLLCGSKKISENSFLVFPKG